MMGSIRPRPSAPPARGRALTPGCARAAAPAWQIEAFLAGQDEGDGEEAEEGGEGEGDTASG